MPRRTKKTSGALHDLQTLDIHPVVANFIQFNLHHPLVKAVVLLLDVVQAQIALQRLMDQLLSTLTDDRFRNGILDAIKPHVEAHPWPTTFFIVGIVLLCNPLAIAGFGALGLVAGSLAAAWQSTMGGTVAAGSAFAVLQSWGMKYSIVIPLRTIITAGTAAAAAAGEQIAKTGHDAWIIANAGGKEVERWGKGEYGSPVTQWWDGAYGDPVTRWWKGDYGAPVTGWAKSLVRK